MATLVGTWVTSYTGWMHFFPPDIPAADTYDEFVTREKELPPLIGGQGVSPRFRWPWGTWPDISKAKRLPDGYYPREGYFAIAGVIRLDVDADNTLTGFEQFNRGGRHWKINEILSGGFDAEIDPETSVNVPTIRTVHRNYGDQYVENVYTYVARSDDEIDWVAKTSHVRPDQSETDDFKRYRARVAHGTFRRRAPSTV